MSYNLSYALFLTAMKFKIICVIFVLAGLVSQSQILYLQFCGKGHSDSLLRSALCAIWPVVGEEVRSVRFILRVIDGDGHPLAGADIYRRYVTEEEAIGITDAFGGWQKSLQVTGKDALLLVVRKNNATGLLHTTRQFHIPAGRSEWHRTVQLDSHAEIR